MGCDMMVAVGQTTVHKHTLVGANLFHEGSQRLFLKCFDRMLHSQDDNIQLGSVALPQARQTHRVHGLQFAESTGIQLGCNEHHLAVGLSTWRSKAPRRDGLSGSGLVRLALERCASAANAVEVLTDLIGRHGIEGDQIFMIADGREAFVVETTGTHWALLECPQARAVSDIGMIHQDWRRVSHGVAEYATQNQWWAGDGNKLDFVGCLSEETPESKQVERRWGRATLALAQQEGALDPIVMRRLLSDHFEDCQDLGTTMTLHGSIVMSLAPNPKTPVRFWYAPDLHGQSMYFPILLDAELPEAWKFGPVYVHGSQARQRDVIDRLQAKFDQEMDAALMQIGHFHSIDKVDDARHLAQQLVDRQMEEWQREAIGRSEPRKPHMVDRQGEDMLAFVAE